MAEETLDRRHPVRQLIEKTIVDATLGAATATRYRKPLIGFASASDPDFALLKAVVDPSHILPGDILPGAQTVISFSLPFAPGIVRANRVGASVAEEWAVAYEETNRLIQSVCCDLVAKLESLGIRSAWELPTHNFDRTRLVARWSHKSVAYVAGLGEFGLHRMLITSAGCAGRFGSIVVDAELPVSSRTSKRLALPCERGCRACFSLCPVGALGETGLDKHKCYARCLEADAHFKGKLGGVHDVCGKCATGPCALTSVTGRSETKRSDDLHTTE